MRKRIQWCALEGQDALEPDDLDGYTNPGATGVPGGGWHLTRADSLGFERWLAYQAHHLGLAIFQKNDPADSRIDAHFFDGLIDEQCNHHHDPCAGPGGDGTPYLQRGKPVLDAEYVEDGETTASFCPPDVAAGISGALFNVDLNGRIYAPCAPGRAVSAAGRHAPYRRTMSRELRIAPEVASMLPAPHLAQLGQDALGEDNVCVACGGLIEGPAAELVVLHDERALLARLAHPACVRSGVYEWPGTSAAIAGLTLRPDGLDVAAALVWRPRAAAAPSASLMTAPAPRAIVLLEPRIHVSLDGGDEDPHEQLFAAPLGLHPVSGALDELDPPLVPDTRLRAAEGGLALTSEALRISIPARADTLARWRAHADGGRALVILGRGLGIARPDAELAPALAEALALRPCWAATIAVDESPTTT